MYDYFKIINNTKLVLKIRDNIKSAKDYIVIGDVELDNSNSYVTYFNITFKDDNAKDLCKDKISVRFRYDKLPKDFMIIHEVGLRTRKFDNVKYLDYGGDLLFTNTWCL